MLGSASGEQLVGGCLGSVLFIGRRRVVRRHPLIDGVLASAPGFATRRWVAASGGWLLFLSSCGRGGGSAWRR